MATLTLEDATIAFGGVRAVDGVSVRFAEGRITGLIGPNGSGKSTLINLVSGQHRPGKGRILLDGVPISGRRADDIVRLGVARTFQVPKMPRQLSIDEVISVPFIYAGRRRHLPAGLRDAVAIARFCGIRHPMDTPCGNLSVPDLRRLEIARALACGPSILLLDEAMAGLSLGDAAEIVDIVRQLNAGGMTVIVIEHVMRIIATLCHEVVVLNNGTLLASGAPAEVLADARVAEAYLGKGFPH